MRSLIAFGIIHTSKGDILSAYPALKNKVKSLKHDIIYASSVNVILITKEQKKERQNIHISQKAFLIGNIYHKSSGVKATLNEIEKEFKCPENITRKFWGDYIIIWSDGEMIQVLRSPGGHIPFFYIKQADDCIFWGIEIDFFYSLLPVKPTFKLDYFFTFLLEGNLLCESTPFQNIFELPNGCRLKIFSELKIKSDICWQPLENVYQNSTNEFSELFFETLSGVLKAKTLTSDGVFLELSGGLDSSALLFFLKEICNISKDLKAVTYFHPGVQSSNELKYAQQACKETQVHLIPLDYTDMLPLSPTIQHTISPSKPVVSFLEAKKSQTLFNLGDEYESPLFVSGHGGDSAFLCPPSKSSLIDSVISQKSYMQYYSKIKDFKQIVGGKTSYLVISTLSGLFSYLLNIDRIKHPLYTAPAWMKPILDQKVRFKEFEHPSLKSKSKILPGKKRHVSDLCSTLASIQNGVANSNTTFFPFLSQPMIELALSVPTYETYAQGYDRYLVRNSIHSTFKTNIVWRKGKGETSGVFQLGVKAQLEHILELCLEGFFAQNHLINKKLLHENIKGIANGFNDNLWPFAHLLCAEIYLGYWTK